MIAWVVLALLVPLILVPLVLLFGFAGCFTKPPPPSAPVIAFQAVFDRDVDKPNRTVIIRIEPTRLLRGGTQVTLSIGRPVSGPLLITALYISQVAESGDEYDASTDITPVLPDGLSVLPNPDSVSVELDPFPYDLDNSRPLLLAFDIGANGAMRTESNVPISQGRSYTSLVGNPPIHESSMTERLPNYEEDNRIYIVHEIRVT